MDVTEIGQIQTADWTRLAYLILDSDPEIRQVLTQTRLRKLLHDGCPEEALLAAQEAASDQTNAALGDFTVKLYEEAGVAPKGFTERR